MNTNPFMPVTLVNVRGTELLDSDTREQYRQKLARITLDSMVQFVGLLDAKGTVLEINQVALDAVGITLSDVEGKPFWTTFWWQVSEEINAILREAILRASQGEFVRWDTPIYGRAGGKETIIIDASLCPVKDAHGNVVFIAAEGRDITEKKAYEREIARQREELAQLDQLKTQFFANISHEFRTPLTLMMGPLEDALADVEGLSAANRERLELAHRNSLRQLKLVNTLLDFSRIEAGRIEASYEPTDLSVLTADLASVFRSAIERAGMRLVVDCPPLPETVYVDHEMWEKVVLNLLSNAFKFTFEGEIEVSLRQVDSAVQLTVRDTGTGIPVDEMPRLFERFHRVKGARGRSYEGSGIGLALVQELVKLHGGKVGVESDVERGSVFTVTIPLGRAHLPADRIEAARTLTSTGVRSEAFLEEIVRWFPDERHMGPTQPREPYPDHLPDELRRHPVGWPPDGRLAGQRILLADDNADMREYVQRLLSGYEVETVADGVAALRAARERVPGLVLTDVMMPGMDGFALLRELRADPRTREVPVILLSARAGEESRIEGLGAGADDYLIKPFSAREVLARVQSHLALAKLRREAGEAVRQREEHLRAVVDTTPACIKVVAADGTLLDMNAAGLAMVDADGLEQVQGRSVYTLICTEDRDAFRAFNERVCRGEKGSLEFEIVGLRGTKRRMETNAAPLCGSDGSFRQLAITQDITERKRAEEAIGRQNERLRLLWEAAGVLLTTDEPDAMLRGLFAKIGESLGLDVYLNFMVTETGDALRLVSCAGIPEEAARSISRLEFGQAVCGTVALHRTPIVATRIQESGEPMVQVVKGFGIRAYACNPLLAGGRLLGTLSFASRTRDHFEHEEIEFLETISQYVTVAYERLRLIEQLRDQDRRKDEFLATLAHELRNPLAPLRTAAALVQHTNPPDPDAQWGLNVIDRQVRHLTRLVDDLLDLSRITRDVLDLRRERLDLAEVLEAAVETSRPLIEEGGQAFVVTPPPEPMALDADPIRLAQVIANLLNNAAKYTEKGGHIQLTAERHGDEAVVTVQDTGIGIPAELLPGIFDMFTQGERSRERLWSGLGIGLTLVKRIVELHGGTVTAQSDGPGHGSTFIVRLPVVKAPTPIPPQVSTAPPPTVPVAPYRILVVDDNRISAASFALLLRRMGHDLRTAHDGVEAVAEAEAFRPDVVLLDIGLPTLNGYEVARQIRQQPWGQRMLLIAVTGWGQAADRQRAKDAGFDHHLVKPVNTAALIQRLASR